MGNRKIETSTLSTKTMLLPNSEFCLDANKHRAYRACIQATNSHFFNTISFALGDARLMLLSTKIEQVQLIILVWT